MRILILIIAAFFSAIHAEAKENIDSLLSAANNKYIRKDFHSAAEIYKKIIGFSFRSAEVYYNLGNAYYKMDKIAPSVLAYERAIRLSPGDEDIKFNLRLANLKAVDRIDPMPVFFVLQVWRIVSEIFPADTWAWTGTVLLWVSVMILASFLYSRSFMIRKILFYFLLPVLAALILSFCFSIRNHRTDTKAMAAIITIPAAYVKSSPEEKGMDLFLLHEGVKVTVLDALGEWKKIRLADGKTGWISESGLEII